MSEESYGIDDLNREHFESLDASDRLSHLRDEFILPSDVIYLDGMSLGALPSTAEMSVSRVVDEEWGRGLIRSWNDANWIEAPQRIAGKIAPLIGAASDEVIVADSTSVNLFKLLVAALRNRNDRRVILMERESFPTDIYVARGVESLRPDVELRLVPSGKLQSELNSEVAVLLLTHVDFKTGNMHDMADLTRRAHDVGAMVLWDLSHSTGAVPLELSEWQVDLAVGCGYKYLNGGPGAPSFMFAARRHHSTLDQPITAWMGHDQPFEFSLDYVPASGVRRLLSGTPPILSLAAMEAGLSVWERVDIDLVREKSITLSQSFLRIVETQLGSSEIALASSRAPERRGSHLAFHHPNAYEVIQALIARGVIGDYREPDLMRFGFTPLYTRFADVWDAAVSLVDVIKRKEWDQTQFRQRSAVT